VLGGIGRNFAAGMSGGLAYVLDLPEHRVNAEMVDIDPLDEDDRAFLRDVIERHQAETDSAVAWALLTDWDMAVERFTKVMPKDYKRVLQAREEAERDGRDVNEAIMEAAHG
jgi:glutamate synthase (NADPH/NADH) large chain